MRNIFPILFYFWIFAVLSTLFLPHHSWGAGIVTRNVDVDNNKALDVSAGGTNAVNAEGARANLGITSLFCWPGLPSADNQMLQATGVGSCQWVSVIDGLINDAGTENDDLLSAMEIDTRIATRQKAASPVPVTATDACTAGDWAYDTGYEYRCVATDTWKRSGLASW